MKSHVVLIVMTAAIAAGTALHAYKTRQPDELDKIGKSLAEAQNLLPQGSRISFKGEPSKSELLSWARYAIVPAYLDPNARYDTMLIIRYKANNGDSALSNIESSRKPFWQYTDSIYHYSLSIAH
ncbi:hypothetical protein [Polluticoccus soli]|uniref:hypothetical protein n=1 Tax=Polluticoccus soli TaxID=3034150 RepID=UPI0023E1F404|nr:hypothetical protein [Flavipsychrobacter sp. JY13-12]